MRPEEQFHVGIVAGDLAATRAELRWCAEIGGPTLVRLPVGDALTCAYSATSPRVEMVARA